jgi:aminoglycoside/choline kinase family phosphotransferase
MGPLEQLFERWAGEPCIECLALSASGSSRRYFRLRGATHSCIGTEASDVRENEAFFAFSRHFGAKQMPVPELYAVADDRKHYLQQDLGDQTLYGLLYEKKRQGGGFDAEMLALYRQALADLAALQVAGRDIDFRLAYPREAFDRRSILWDLNYFKYFFLKLNHIDFDEELLENDFERLAEHLLAADCTYFLYRDFQGRNIMIAPSKKLYYIDYQGGRRGAAQYDVASLLYSAKSDIPETIRTELLNHYLDVRGLRGDERRQWLDHFWAYLLVRILQTLGAYGYRGLFERKPYFIESIPLALNNLRRLTEDHHPTSDMPELDRVISVLCNKKAETTAPQTDSPSTTLTVEVSSFSYKQGLPQDNSGNGGGHIFDCRALPNPGRYAEYKCYTGKDRPVIDFLREKPAVDLFLNHAKAIVAQSVDKYLERNFTHLSVAFGCTGGQHRSVYCAEQMAAWLRNTYPKVQVVVCHREQQQR